MAANNEITITISDNSQSIALNTIPSADSLPAGGVVSAPYIKDIYFTGEQSLVVVLSNGYTYTSGSLIGEPGRDGQDGIDGADGVGIQGVNLNDDYTLTIYYTDGTSTTTSSVRGEQGEQGEKGDTPVITGEKVGKVTTLYSDGVEIAVINDGEDGTSGVQSVNGKTGAVVLDADDVGAMPDDAVLEVGYDESNTTNYAMTNVAVTADPTYTPTGIVNYTTDTVNEITGISGALTFTTLNMLLTITGVSMTTTSSPKTFVTGISGFGGNSVRLIAKESEE